MKKHKNKTLVFVIFILFLSLFRIDYRFKTTVECCSDDYDYFLHASTIALDFDLDYSNQEPREYSYRKNGSTTPIGFIGSGILSAPFLFVGEKINTSINSEGPLSIFNYKLIFYSIAPLFYLFLSFVLILKTLTLFEFKYNKYLVLLYFFGSGITYYSFERFSMTHTYEVFTVSLIMFTSAKYYIPNKPDQNYYAFILPLSILIGFFTRMSNFYIFLIPLFIKTLLKKNNFKIDNKILLNKYFLSSSIISFIVYFLISIELYGELVFNPQRIYGSNINVEDYFLVGSNLLEAFISMAKSLFLVSFSFEFGIFWISSILFVGLISILNLFKVGNRLESFLILIFFAQNIFIIHIWQSAGSSYGFRYLFSLIPISIVIFFNFYRNNKLINKYLLIYSIFGIMSVIFFETTELTQLSLGDEVNSFGRTIRYTEPNYVIGLVQSFFNFESYLIIFSTSFLGAVFFKFFLIFLSVDELFNLLNKLRLPTDNSDFQTYVSNLDSISIDRIIFVSFVLLLASYYIVHKLPEKERE